MFFFTAAAGPACPISPDVMNGSVYYTTDDVTLATTWRAKDVQN
jgi:hypothetical protein